MGPSTEPQAAQREWTSQRQAVMVVDLVESVRLMDRDEVGTIARWRGLVDEVTTRLLPAHRGRLVRSLGDGLLVRFDNAADAVAAAAELHRTIARRSEGLPPALAMNLRVGINEAEVVVDTIDIFGHGVNIAARLAQLGRPGDTIVSGEVGAALIPGLDQEAEDLGLCWLKHVERPLRAFRIVGTAPPPNARPPRVESLRPCLAVIPFEMRGDARADGLGEILADELITALSGSPHLQVVSRLSSRAVAGRNLMPAQLATLLGADYVVSGVCRCDGERLRIDAEVCDTRDAVVLVHERIECGLHEVTAPDAMPAARLVDLVGRAILDSQLHHARQTPLPNLAAYTMLLGGIGLTHRFARDDFKRGRELLEALVERWPRHAAPLAWLGRWHLFDVLQGWTADTAASQRAARAACDRALDLDPQSSTALTVAGSIKVSLDKDLDGGAARYEQAIASNPNDSMAWLLKGTTHAFRGEGEAALDGSARAARLSPLDPLRFLYDCHAAGAALAAGDYTLARERAQRSLRANRLHLSTLRVLAIAQQLGGDEDAARGTVQDLLQLDPRQSVSRYLATAPSAAYPIGQLCAQALSASGLPR